MREIALATEQLAAKLLFELLDGAGQRGLRDVTLFGGAGEVQQSRYRKEVSDLVHFHADTDAIGWCEIVEVKLRRRAIADSYQFRTHTVFQLTTSYT
jgi:hypothetical protein